MTERNEGLPPVNKMTYEESIFESVRRLNGIARTRGHSPIVSSIAFEWDEMGDLVGVTTGLGDPEDENARRLVDHAQSLAKTVHPEGLGVQHRFAHEEVDLPPFKQKEEILEPGVKVSASLDPNFWIHE